MILLLSQLAFAQETPSDEELPDEAVEFSRERPPETLVQTGPTVGAGVGLGLPMGELGAGLAPRLELGFVPEALGGRLHLGLSGSWLRSAGTVSVLDPRLEQPWSEELLQHGVYGALAVSYRVFGRQAKASPELRLGPQLAYTRTLSGGQVLGAGLHLGGLAELGLNVLAGPGQLRLGLALDALGADPLTGLDRQWTLTPGLSYRVVL